MEFKYEGNSLKSGVYKITNKINNKIYIGSAKLFKVRASQHLSSLEKQKHQNKHLQASFNKHGSDAFLFEVLEVVKGDKLQRTQREKELLDEQIILNKWDECYNISKNPIQKEGSWSKTPEETRKLLSENSKKLWQNKEYRENHCQQMKKLWQNPAHKEKMCLLTTGQKRTEETKRKISEANKGKFVGRKITELTKQKIALSTKGHKVSDNTKLKISAANKGKKRTEKTKKKISIIQIGKRASEETKRKMSDAHRGRQFSKESRKKMSEARKGYKHSAESYLKRTITRKLKGVKPRACSFCKFAGHNRLTCPLK